MHILSQYSEVVMKTNLISSFAPTAKKLISVGMVLGLALVSIHANAQTRGKPKPLYIMGQDMPVTVTATQYEIALVQVLSEICPAMLTQAEREQFDDAYQKQLRSFIPKEDDPSEILRRLGGSPEYRVALQKVRGWTATYPDSENRALCQELAQKTHAF